MTDIKRDPEAVVERTARWLYAGENHCSPTEWAQAAPVNQDEFRALAEEFLGLFNPGDCPRKGMVVAPQGMVTFLAKIYNMWRDNYWGEIDGADLHDSLVKAGILIERPATAEDCKTDWAQEWGYEEGDPVYEPAPGIRAMIEAASDE